MKRNVLLSGLSLILFVFLAISHSKEATQADQPIATGPYTLEYPANFGDRLTIPADNPMTKEGVHLGRMLFYEKRLSADNSMSCGTCHQQKVSTVQLKIII